MFWRVHRLQQIEPRDAGRATRPPPRHSRAPHVPARAAAPLPWREMASPRKGSSGAGRRGRGSPATSTGSSKKVRDVTAIRLAPEAAPGARVAAPPLPPPCAGGTPGACIPRARLPCCQGQTPAAGGQHAAPQTVKLIRDTAVILPAPPPAQYSLRPPLSRALAPLPLLNSRQPHTLNSIHVHPFIHPSTGL